MDRKSWVSDSARVPGNASQRPEKSGGQKESGSGTESSIGHEKVRTSIGFHLAETIDDL